MTCFTDEPAINRFLTASYFLSSIFRPSLILATILICCAATSSPGDIKRMADAGLDRVVFGLPPAKADEVLPVMDACAEIARS